MDVKLPQLIQNVLLFDRLLGQVEIPIRELRKNGKEIKKQSYELEDGKHRPTIVSPVLLLSFYFVVVVIVLFCLSRLRFLPHY